MSEEDKEKIDMAIMLLEATEDNRSDSRSKKALIEEARNLLKLVKWWN